MLMYCRRFHHTVSQRRIFWGKPRDIERIQLISRASVAVDNIKTTKKKMGAKHPEFCQKQELRAINSQSVCTQQACYLNADESPVNFDDCLSSYFSMSIMSLLLIFSPLSFTFIFSIHYSLSVFQLSIKAPLPRDRWQIDKHLPIKCSIFYFFFIYFSPQSFCWHTVQERWP